MVDITEGVPMDWSQASHNEWFLEADPQLKAIASWRRWDFSDTERDEALQRIRLSMWAYFKKHGQKPEPKLLRSMAVRRCIDVVRIRSRHRRRTVSISTPDDRDSGVRDREQKEEGLIGMDPLELIDLQERAQSLAVFLRRISPLCQDALHRFYVEGMSYQEIAAVLDLSINTVGSRLSKCLEKLKVLVRNVPLFQEDWPFHRR
jgi:RNA polymerase sigma factor (sigma-70 family)